MTIRELWIPSRPDEKGVVAFPFTHKEPLEKWGVVGPQEIYRPALDRPGSTLITYVLGETCFETHDKALTALFGLDPFKDDELAALLYRCNITEADFAFIIDERFFDVMAVKVLFKRFVEGHIESLAFQFKRPVQNYAHDLSLAQREVKGRLKRLYRESNGHKRV